MTPRHAPQRVRDTGTVLDEYITEQQLADELKINLRTMKNWRISGYAPPVTKIGIRVYFARSDVMEWLRTRCREVA